MTPARLHPPQLAPVRRMLEATPPRPVFGHSPRRRRVSLRPGLGSSSPELSERSGAWPKVKNPRPSQSGSRPSCRSCLTPGPTGSGESAHPTTWARSTTWRRSCSTKWQVKSQTVTTPSADTIDVRAAYVHYRFAGRLRALQRSSRTYGHLDTALNLASIAAGIGASLVAASRSEPLWTISLGVAIAACQTLSQWLKPSLRAARRGRAALELRTEAWNILEGHEQYRGKDVDGAWDIFCSQVDKIDGQAQRQEDAQSCEATTVTLNGGGLASHSDR